MRLYRAARAPLRGILFVLLLLAAGPLRAQGAVPGAEPEPGTELAVYLVTMGPGELVWERFGHNALWVHDPDAHTDIAYNYGMFDFGQPGFVRRFLMGRMTYWMEGFDANLMVAAYVQADRSVWAQELNLTPAERMALRDFLVWNARPENRYYRYDYYRDNCSTRLRDAIDRALGGALARASRPQLTGTTYRSHTNRLTAGALAAYTGINLALGQPGDRELSAWEEMFVPMRLRDHLRTTRIARADGTVVPLVRSEQHVFAARRPAPPDAPPDYLAGFAAAGILLGALLAWLGSRAGRGTRSVAFAAAGSAWGLLVGVLGTIIAGLWALTDHTFTYANENVLQANPLSLLLAAALLAALARPYARRWSLWLAAAVAALAALGALLQMLPGLDQGNGEIVALLLPAHVGLAYGAWRWHSRSPRP